LKDPRFAKFVVFVNGTAPGVLLAIDAYQRQLGANPIENAIRTLGLLALIFLLLTLCVTPLRRLTGWNWLSHFRRMLGLFAFFYALAHFSIYLGFYQGFSISGVIHDTVARPFILFGMTGLACLTPLALTSTNGIIKRMGARRWKQLHMLIYVAAIAGVVHYWMMVKADTRQPKAFAVALVILLGYRLIRFSQTRAAVAAPPR
jgi:DMSO/TMAO reductase YedYZ heme-binding membrane subunit